MSDIFLLGITNGEACPDLVPGEWPGPCYDCLSSPSSGCPSGTSVSLSVLGKMKIWRVKFLAKVAHTIVTVVLNIPTPVRMTLR